MFDVSAVLWIIVFVYHLRRYCNTGLRLKPKKCKFAIQQIEYFEHTLTPKRVRPNDAKITAVKEFLTVKEVRG